MRRFDSEFRTLEYIILNAERILLVAHSRPDPDTVGANLAFEEHLRARKKIVDIACLDAYPEALKVLGERPFLHPESLDLASYDAIIACDSVDRGFHTFAHRLEERQVTVLVDHHPDINLQGDVLIIDPAYSSTSELIYLFLESIGAHVTRSMATMLLTGLLFDTGGLQHSNVSPQVMRIASELVKRGAPLPKIAQVVFTNKNIAALRLWGKAFERAKLNPHNGMLVTAITQKDVLECQASVDDIYQVTTILSTVPDAKFALVLSEREGNTVRASLRSMEHHHVDVSEIAHRFGGGGHKLASGFEIPGKIVETPGGWQIA